MKKLIIVLAVVLAAAVSQAATCSWTGLNVAKQGDAAATSYTMYLIDPTVTSLTAMAEALSAGDMTVLGTTKVVTDTTGLAAGTTAVRWSKVGFGDYAAGETYAYYTVILNNGIADATHYMLTGVVSAKAPSSGALAMSFGTQAANTWVEIAPEPTSGLMMLLGMGVLALRRRRA